MASEESGGAPVVRACSARGGLVEVRDGLRLIEVLFERFDDIATQTGDAAILTEAQIAAENCVRWLALVGGVWRNDTIR